MKNSYDFIIAGQGLAGSLLALVLEEKNKSVLVIDPGNSSASSRIAAGIIHPITGRRIVKSWMADELIPFSEMAYDVISKKYGKPFYFRKNILELFTSVKHRNDWIARSAEPGMKQYIGNEIPPEKFPGLHNPLGGMQVNGGGYLLIREFLDTVRKDFIAREGLINESLPYDELKITEDGIYYKNLSGRQLIFCEGAEGRHNPWFSHLPFVPSKGEIMTIHSEGIPEEYILNKGIYILPLGQNMFRVGATHEWEGLDNHPTAEAKDKMSRLLKSMIQVPFEIISHEASIRPTVRDRRPFLGTHPVQKNIHVFNGLGTKGVMLGPWFARLFSDYLCGKVVLPDEVNCSRFS